MKTLMKLSFILLFITFSFVSYSHSWVWTLFVDDEPCDVFDLAEAVDPSIYSENPTEHEIQCVETYKHIINYKESYSNNKRSEFYPYKKSEQVPYADRSDLMKQYLEYSGTFKNLIEMYKFQAEQSANNLNKSRSLSKKFIDDYLTTFTEVMIEDFWNTGGLFDMIKPMFNSLSNQELEKIVLFYKTTEGKKMAKISENAQSHIETSLPKWENRVRKFILPVMIERLQEKGWDQNGKRIY